jgi:hypothetical protein
MTVLVLLLVILASALLILAAAPAPAEDGTSATLLGRVFHFAQMKFSEGSQECPLLGRKRSFHSTRFGYTPSAARYSCFAKQRLTTLVAAAIIEAPKTK